MTAMTASLQERERVILLLSSVQLSTTNCSVDESGWIHNLIKEKDK